MKKKSKKWLSMLLSTTMILGSFSIPAAAAENAPAEVVVNEATARAADEKDGRTVNFNKDWKFKLGDQPGAEGKDYNDASWENVRIPHDFSIIQEFSNDNEAESGFLPGGIGWYRKTVVFPKDYADKNIVLNFDGVYNYADVYVNGTKVGENRYGYISFAFDISKLLKCDGTTKNVIAVKAENKIPSSRWYSGSGIYRDVALEVTGNVHVGLDGTYVTTPDIETKKDGDATVKVETVVENDTDASVSATVRTSIVDADGKSVSPVYENAVAISKNKASTISLEAKVNKPKLWDPDNPNLYTVKTEVLVGGKVTDTYLTEFGFRYIKYDANTGFSINGKNVKLKGVCMHHDQGALGSAAYYDAVYRQVKILKDMGCNAIRTSHNSPSEVLVTVCNRLGMMLQDEVFDGWTYAKNGNSNDFSVYFNQKMSADNQVIGGTADKIWAQFAVESTFKRDRNAPSVIMWSIGNELPTGAGGNMSAEYPGIAKNMIQWMQGWDRTRPITMGDNNGTTKNGDFRDKIDEQLAEAGGVVGLNYYPGRFNNYHTARPDWKLYASETASPSNSRGVYNTLKHYSQSGDYQCTAYDTDCVGWGNLARDAWYPIIVNDFMAGEFIWTGFDYIGEPTPWNGVGRGSSSGDVKAIPNSSFFGVIDTAGFPKDSFYFYTSQWRTDKKTLHIVPQSWNEKDLVVNNGKVPVYIYSNAAKVELYLNGTLIGTSTRTSNKTKAGYEYGTYVSKSENTQLCEAVKTSGSYSLNAEYKVAYQAGTLSAKAYDEAGKEIKDFLGLSSVTTNSDAGSKMKVTAEKTEIQADGSSLCYISVDVLDKDGNFVSAARNNIRFALTGHGTIVGVDNGNPSSVDKFQQKSVLTSDKTANIDAFSGKALVIVRSTETAGGFSLKIDSPALGTEKLDVKTVNGKDTKIYIKEYNLTSKYQVEMGTAPVLQQSVPVVMSDGAKKTATVVWQTVGEDIYNTPGEYVISGTLKADAEEVPVRADLSVAAKIVAMENYARATSSGVIPKLPDTVNGILPDGRTYDGNYKVKWESISEAQVKTVGTILTVKGTAEIAAGVTLPVTATIRVAEGVTMESKNVAPTKKTLTENCDPASDNLQSITDGNYDGGTTSTRWTNWNSALLNSNPAITFTWDEAQLLDHVDMYYYKDAKVNIPQNPTIFRISANGKDYTPVTATASAPKQINGGCEMISYQFAGSQKALGLEATFAPANLYVGLTECEIYTSTEGYKVNSTAVLDTLTVDGVTPQGFTAGAVNAAGYKVTVNSSKPVIAAKARDNAAVTIVPMDNSNNVRVLVQSEDRMVSNIYVINIVDPATIQAKQELNAAVTAAEAVLAKGQGNATEASWLAFQKALSAAKAAPANADKATITKLMNQLKAAQAGIGGAANVSPAAPTIKSVKSKLTKKASTVQITVTPVANAESYTVYRKSGNVNTKIGTTAAGKVVVTDKNPVSGKTVSYYAVANGKNSPSKDGAAKSIKLPAATKKVTAKKSGSAIRISWTKVKKATGYYVFRSTKKTSGYVRVGKTSSKKVYYFDKKAKAGKKYYYKVVTKEKSVYSNLSKPSKQVQAGK